MVMLTLTQQWSGGISTLARQVLADIDRGGGAGAPSVRAAFVTPLREAADSYAAMQRLLDPCRVVLAGPPNAGKSTLANTLVGRPVSIVHETPGTTRDWVSELAIIDGAPIMLTDTAGLWHPPGEDGETQGDDADLAQSVDAQAVTRAKGQIAMADIVLLLVNEDTGDGGRWGAKGLMPPDARVVRVWAKADLRKPVGEFDIAVSAASGEGLAQLRQRILEELGLRNFDPSAPHAFTARQVDLLRATAQAIEDDQPALARSELAQLLEGR
jgi:tRNA modification GTPase